MRVLIAGGGGAIGRPLTRRLVGAGHEVHSLTRSEAKRPQIESLGARAVIADALDERAVREAVERVAPEAIVHQLTALPAEGPTRVRDMDATNELRTTGTDHLVAAAAAGGVRRMVAQSIVFVYGYRDHGPELIDEGHAAEVGGRFDRVLGPLRYLEQRVMGTPGLEGIALRYGLFYSAQSPTVTSLARRLRRRMLPLPGGGEGVCSFIHLDDAATATVAALERGAAGQAYNVVDDEPARWADYVGEIARRAGAPAPRSVPMWLGRLAAPYAAYFIARVKLGASNRRARDELGWAPAYPSYREGLAAPEPVALAT